MKHVPMRMCLACRISRPKNELIRINGDDTGRGAYVCNDPVCIDKLRKNKKLSSSLKEALAELE